MAWLYNNPADAAEDYLDQIPSTISQYYNPYITAGQQSLGTAQNQYNELLGLGAPVGHAYGAMITHPGQVVNAIGSGYQQSPGYDWQMEQGQDAITNAASAGGYLGSPQQQQYAGSLAENLANQDYYNYLNTALGQFDKGLSGGAGLYETGLGGEQQIANQDYYNYLNTALGQFDKGLSGGAGLYETGLGGEQQIANMGLSAGNELANNLMQALITQAQLAYAGAANQDEHQGGILGDTLGAVGSLFGDDKSKN